MVIFDCGKRLLGQTWFALKAYFRYQMNKTPCFIRISFGILMSFSYSLQAQNACNLTVEAGDDVTICEGDNTTLNGQVTGGNNPEFLWTPALGLSDPSILNPIASPMVTTTYLLTAMSNSDHIIINGGFETGDIAPSTSSYTMVADPVSIATNAPNFYGILSVPQIVQAFGCQPDIGAFTMVIHGSTGVGVDFWCQTVNVTPNTDYKLSFKVFGIPYFFAPAPNIVMKVNGTTIGSVTAPNGLCNEDEGDFTWNSGGSNTAEICLANSTVAGLGSMCSVDDIEMVECCVLTDSVSVTVAPNSVETQDHIICPNGFVEVGGQQFDQAGQFQVVLDNYLGCDSIITVQVEVADIEAFITPSNSFNCLLDQATLDGTLSNGTFGIQSYFWSTLNGVILSNPTGATVTIGAPGNYTLTVTTSNGVITCSDDISIDVPIDTVAPIFIMDPAPIAGCQDTVFTLSAVPVNVPGNASILWTTTNGIILSGGTTFSPTVQGTGTYTLTVTNPSNGCATSDSIEVQAGGDVPIIQVLTIPTITCRDSQGLITIQVIQPASDYSILWTTVNGNILQGAQTLSPLVNQAGAYQVLITDTLTGCSNTAVVNVVANTEIPIIALAATDSLDCMQDSLLIVSQIPPGFDSLLISWTTMNGTFLSGADTLLVWIGSAGAYQLVVEDLETGCVDTATINVVGNNGEPLVNVGPDLVIDCNVSTVVPNTLGTDQGSEFNYLWTTDVGNISEDSILQPVFSAPGNYVLFVTNTLTGCMAIDTVIVTLNGNVPIVMIEVPDTLTCLQTSITLTANVTNSGNVTMLWSGPVGGITSGGNSLMAVVQSPGWYFFTATDTLSQCVGRDSVLVIENVLSPQSIILPPNALDCTNPTITLDGSNSLPFGNIQFLWSTINGTIISGLTGPTVIVNSTGVYTLQVTNNANGCTSVSSEMVHQDSGLPIVSILTPDTITCDKSQINLTAIVNPPSAGSTQLWSTIDGTLQGALDSLSITAIAPGTYVFTLTLQGGSCTVTDQVTVLMDTLVPLMQIIGPTELTCIQTSSLLEAQPINFNGILDYLWTQAGNPVGQGNSLAVTSAGTWGLTWTNQANGCSGTQSVTITSNTQSPLAEAGPDQGLPCIGGSAMLDGSASTGQGLLSFLWSTANGQILSGATSAQMVAGSSGTYALLVTDASNGCTSQDSVTVLSQGQGSFAFDIQSPLCNGVAGTLSLLSGMGGQPPYMMTVSGNPGSFLIGEPVSLVSGSWPIQVTDAAGCVFDTMLVMPIGSSIILTAPSEVFITSGGATQIVLSGNFDPLDIASLVWTPDQYLTPTSDPLIWNTNAPVDLIYQVTVTTLDGCEGSASIQVRVQDLRLLYVPNAFSPNNVDGINDTFFPYSNIGGFQEVKSMTIFDRWGNQLFQREDFPVGEATMGWDGSYKGKRLDPGVYVWVIEVVTAADQTRIYKGEVTLF